MRKIKKIVAMLFAVDGTESGTITGLNKGGSYTVTITNSDRLPAGYTLKGYGKIVS